MVSPLLFQIGLTATAASCGQVNLSWNASVDNTGGSGLKGYTITRGDGTNITISAPRTTFSDNDLCEIHGHADLQCHRSG